MIVLIREVFDRSELLPVIVLIWEVFDRSELSETLSHRHSLKCADFLFLSLKCAELVGNELPVVLDQPLQYLNAWDAWLPCQLSHGLVDGITLSATVSCYAWRQCILSRISGRKHHVWWSTRLAGPISDHLLMLDRSSSCSSECLGGKPYQRV